MAAALIAVSAASAYAVPAMPGVRQWRQADGRTIAVQVRGDENMAIYTTDDDHFLTLRDGNFYYAHPSADGLSFVPSKYRAVPTAERSAEVTRFLNSLDPAEMRQAAAAQLADGREKAAMALNAAMAPMAKAGPGLFNDRGNNFPSSGDRKVLVILMQYPDRPFTVDDPKAYFTRQLNEPGFSDNGGTGSAAEYFRACSFDQFRPQFDVYGPYTAGQGYKYYGGETAYGNDSDVRALVLEAINKANADGDMSQYDTDGDGKIDNITVIYAGVGQASSNDPDAIWPHSSTVSSGAKYDGKTAYRYLVTNEALPGGKPAGIGTLCHEFSHVMGLPDLYDTGYSGQAFLPGDWDIMSSGSYLNNGNTPCLYSAQERYAMGWIEPIDITGSMKGQLYPSSQSDVVYKIPTTRAAEYYLLENRQRTGWDRYLPGHGMLVWHIHFVQSIWNENSPCNYASHQYVDIVEADNILTEGTRDGDTFPGASGITSWTDNTTPSMKTWQNLSLNLPITEIAENAPYGIVTFNVAGGNNSLAAVAVNAPTDVTPRSFNASWSKSSASDAEYLLSVYTKVNGANVYVPGYDGRNVRQNTSFTVSGLEPSTQYYYNVTVATPNASSPASAEATATTGALTHDFVIPVAKDATGISQTGFTANWDAIDGGADSYELNVYQHNLKGSQTVSEGFDGSGSDWFSTATNFNTSLSYSGNSAPSLRLDPDQYVCTPYLDAPIRKFSFKHRGRNKSSNGRIVIEAYVGECWVPFATASIGTTRMIELAYYNVPAEAEALRVLFADTKGELYVDDLTVEYGGQTNRTLVATRSTSGLSAAIDGVHSGTEHYYNLTALKGGIRSMVSNDIRVRTTGTSGIENVDTDTTVAGFSVNGAGGMLEINAPEGGVIAVTDLSGRTVYTGYGSATLNVARGMYIVSLNGSNAVKVMVR